MDPTIIFLIIFLIIAVGGLYFGYTKWWIPKQCVGQDATSKVATWMYDSTNSKCVANVCIDGFTGADCSTVVVDISCPTNCNDTKCTNKQCTKCNTGYGTKLTGTPSTDGTCPSYYKEYDGIDYRGPDISSSKLSDKDDCISQCSANPLCMFAVTDKPVTTCWLKKEFGTDAPLGHLDPSRTVLAPVSLLVPPTSS